MSAAVAPSTWEILFGEYDFEKARHYCGSLESFSIKLAVVYMAVIFSIKYFMKDRKPIDTPQVQSEFYKLIGLYGIGKSLFNGYL